MIGRTFYSHRNQREPLIRQLESKQYELKEVIRKIEKYGTSFDKTLEYTDQELIRRNRQIELLDKQTYEYEQAIKDPEINTNMPYLSEKIDIRSTLQDQIQKDNVLKQDPAIQIILYSFNMLVIAREKTDEEEYLTRIEEITQGLYSNFKLIYDRNMIESIYKSILEGNHPDIEDSIQIALDINQEYKKTREYRLQKIKEHGPHAKEHEQRRIRRLCKRLDTTSSYFQQLINPLKNELIYT